MRVLLTGGSGFIGGHIARHLAAEGHELRLLVRPTSDTAFIDDLSFERALGDLRRPDSLAAACAGMDAVVHCAAVLRAVRQEDFMQANRAGTGGLAKSAAEAGVQQFVYISSIAAQGPSRSLTPEPPDTPLHPVSAYGRSKAAGEVEILKQSGRMQITMLRPPLVYGPADAGLLAFFWMARRGFAVRLGDGTNLVDAVYGPDLAGAVSAVLRADIPQVAKYHVANESGPYSWNQLLAALGTAAGRRLWIPSVPPACFQGLARCSEWWSRLTNNEPMLDRARVLEMRQPAWLCDPSSLTQETGWQANTALADGMQDTFNWYREQGWI
ncbi:MAG: NAD-dependent epimerase/dehydratase family protein [Chloroflexi bacterium]|nr:NAD-dependent epimerase/dehydratase family protein [Chloroflexota bacterium]MYJ93839.1 NAD-dependent epimerase/dehydratase family protein [Chloroflexota bacterium]